MQLTKETQKSISMDEDPQVEYFLEWKQAEKVATGPEAHLFHCLGKETKSL